MFNYAYAIIVKETNFCSQVNQNNKPNWIVDNEYCFNVPVNPETASQYAGKYYYDGQWWERVWNTVETTDSDGNTILVTDGTYTDYPFTPSEDGEDEGEDETEPVATVPAEELLSIIVEGE